jgi:hypothetical protein
VRIKRPGACHEQILACVPQKLGAESAGPAGATGLDLQDQGVEHRSVLDLLRNALAAVLRFFASPRPRLRRLDRWLIATLAT